MTAPQHEARMEVAASDASRPPSSSVPLKNGVNETIAVESDDGSAPPTSYPQSWRLWTIYVATLFTMFLVSILEILSDPIANHIDRYR